MTIDSQTNSDHEAISMLLPWWVNQTLDKNDSDRVAGHLADCEACRNEVEQLRLLANSVQTEAQMQYQQHADSQVDFINVMQRINKEACSQSSQSGNTTILNRIVDAFTSIVAPEAMRQWAAPAVIALLVVFAGSQLWIAQDNDGYSVLSSDPDSDSTMQVSVRFAAGTSQAQVSRILDDLADTVEPGLNIARTDDLTYTINYDDTLNIASFMKSITWLKEHDVIEDVDIMH